MDYFGSIFVVQQLIASFANNFDLKAWDALATCLADVIYVDYSDLRGTPPETIPKEHFINLRRAALSGLDTHHLAGNIEIHLSGMTGEVKASMVIYRRSAEGEFFNTHCLYTFGVENSRKHWVINSIVQKVFWSDGQKDIHCGVAK